MPIPLLGALIGAGSGLAGGLLNAGATADQNMRSQMYSREMYERQKADNLAFWQMQNEYNSPQAQMKRFQEAGLNPHLIYGQGNAGNAGSLSAPSAIPPQFRTPEFGTGVANAGLAFMNAMYDLDIKAAQLDNLRAQNTVIKQEALLKEVGTETGRFRLGFESELRDISAESRREQLRQLKTGTDISIERNAREAALNSSSISEAAERMLSMRAQRTLIPYQKGQMSAQVREADERVRQLQKDGVLKDMDIELRKQGINPQDPMWARIVGRILTNLFEEDGSFRSTTGNIWDFLFSR